MTEEDKKRILSEEYADFFIEAGIDSQRLSNIPDTVINNIDHRNAVIYIPVTNASLDLTDNGYPSVPRLFGLVDTLNLEEMGVTKVRNSPSFAYKGQGVLLGFIDSGIDYTNKAFLNEDKTTRILSIWDQSIENLEASEEIFNYGTEFKAEQINLALQNAKPSFIVPSIDNIGHGTTLACLAGGNEMKEADVSGVAPEAEFVIVKLKPAKKSIKFFFGVSKDIVCYQENDIMYGLQYLYNFARKMNRPIAICLALGTNQGAHDGQSALCRMISELSLRKGIAIITAGGNEGNSGHHYYGRIDKSTGYDTIELNIAEKEESFTMEIWATVPGTYSIDVTSPSGQTESRIPARLYRGDELFFLMDNTSIIVQYYLIESNCGDELIIVSFNNPAPGIWKFKFYGKGDILSDFHVWLPLTGYIKDKTKFLQSNPDTTITSPGDAVNAITVTAYDAYNEKLFLLSGRGYTRDNRIKPDLAAPGVNIYCPISGAVNETNSGTSIAAAGVCGIAALVLEWGILKGGSKAMNSLIVKKFLLRGVIRKDNLSYPNTQWGYGIINLYKAFQSLIDS